MILVVDGNQLVHQVWHIAKNEAKRDTGNDEAIPEPEAVLNWYLEKVGHLEEYGHRMAQAWQVEPKFLMCFDSRKETNRAKMFVDYKAHRTTDPAIYESVEDCKQSIEKSAVWSGWTSPDGFEADDAIASIAFQYRRKRRVVIVSTDKDLNQCLMPGRVSIIKKTRMIGDNVNDNGIPVGGKLEADHFTYRMFAEEFGFEPYRWVDYQCLVGDSADNVKGAAWIGEVAAKRIIQLSKRGEAKADHELDELDPNQLQLQERQLAGWSEFMSRYQLLKDLFRLEVHLDVKGVL